MFRFTTNSIAKMAQPPSAVITRGSIAQALLLLLAMLLSPVAYAATEEEKRAAVIQEFARDPMLFSTALVVNMDAEVTSGTLQPAQFNAMITNYFVAIQNTPGAFAERIAAIYDASPAARARLQQAALAIRKLRRIAAQAEAAKRREEELILE